MRPFQFAKMKKNRRYQGWFFEIFSGGIAPRPPYWGGAMAPLPRPYPPRRSALRTSAPRSGPSVPPSSGRGRVLVWTFFRPCRAVSSNWSLTISFACQAIVSRQFHHDVSDHKVCVQFFVVSATNFGLYTMPFDFCCCIRMTSRYSIRRLSATRQHTSTSATSSDRHLLHCLRRHLQSSSVPVRRWFSSGWRLLQHL